MRSRRGFLTGAAASASAGPLLALSGCAAQASRLPIPPLIDAAKRGQAIDLTAQAGEMRFVDGGVSATAGFNGAFLGPTLRVSSGHDVQVSVANQLTEGTTVHWHGLLVPSAVDGGPHNHIAPGQTWRPVLPVRQAASTIWYHAHPHPGTGAQVYAGLAGMMIVTDAEEQALDLPSEYGVDDLPLILQDRQFDQVGRMVYPSDRPSIMHGVRGEVILVNGAQAPTAAPPKGLVRLRLLNGANARIFHLSFSDGRAFDWIGTEGGLLARPVALNKLTLAPAQRAEILVDFSDGGAVDLVTAADDNLPMGGMGMGRGMGGGMIASGGLVLRFSPSSKMGRRRVVPARLASWSRPEAGRAVRRRRLNLTMGMGMGGGLGMGMGAGPGMGRGRMGGMAMGGLHGIDGRVFDMERIDQRVRLGDVEIWEVSAEMMHHPFHMHGVHFEVLSRGGGAPRIEDQGRRDTVLVQEPVELLAHFTQPAPKEPFMYHCHILEHEDHGMMGQYLCV